MPALYRISVQVSHTTIKTKYSQFYIHINLIYVITVQCIGSFVLMVGLGERLRVAPCTVSEREWGEWGERGGSGGGQEGALT